MRWVFDEILADGLVPFLQQVRNQCGQIHTLLRSGVPYKVIGGTRFYDRKEIKDALHEQ